MTTGWLGVGVGAGAWRGAATIVAGAKRPPTRTVQNIAAHKRLSIARFPPVILERSRGFRPHYFTWPRTLARVAARLTVGESTGNRTRCRRSVHRPGIVEDRRGIGRTIGGRPAVVGNARRSAGGRVAGRAAVGCRQRSRVHEDRGTGGRTATAVTEIVAIAAFYGTDQRPAESPRATGPAEATAAPAAAWATGSAG